MRRPRPVVKFAYAGGGPNYIKTCYVEKEEIGTINLNPSGEITFDPAVTATLFLRDELEEIAREMKAIEAHRGVGAKL